MLKEITNLLLVEADINKLSEVTDFVRNTFTECGFDEKYFNQIDIVVEEIFVNIASYAYPQETGGNVIVLCGCKDDTGELVFKDNGIPYDPLKKEDPVVGDPDRMTIGGYGIFMVKKIMDEVTYEYNDSTKENVLTLKKK